MQGIYAIANRVNGKVYIGSSVQVETRWRQHRNALRRGAHTNVHLQRAWDKHGVDAFVFTFVEEVIDERDLVGREQSWLNETRSFERENGYNLSPTAGNTLGFRFTPEQRSALLGKPKSEAHRANLWRDRQVTPEFRDQMAANGRRGLGRPKSLEARRKMSERQSGSQNHSAKLTETIVKEILRRLAAGERGRHLAREFGVHESVVSEIKSGKRWRHVEAAA